MIPRKLFLLAVTGMVLMASLQSQPRSYSVDVASVGQLKGGDIVTLTPFEGRYITSSGAPLVVEFRVEGFGCPSQDMSFMASHLYRRVRPANFLEDPSLYVWEGRMVTWTTSSEACGIRLFTPTLEDGIHTIGVMAFDGSGAQSPWFYVTVVKNDSRMSLISTFPGGDQQSGRKAEESPVSLKPDVIIDTPSQSLSTSSSPVQYVDIFFHTNYPFPVEYFLVQWSFISEGECTYSSSAVVYPTEFNRGVYRLEMRAVFANTWDVPSNAYGKCTFGPGEFQISVSCKTAQGMGKISTITIRMT